VKPRALLLGCAIGAVALSPAAAAAKTKQVSMGLPTKAAVTSFQKLNGDANAFFPSSVTVATGDKVRFTVAGFHNIDFPAAGANPLALFTPTGNKVTGENDAAGAAFWFNGLDTLGFNPELAPAGFGKTFTYNGSKRVLSGLPLVDNPKPVSVRFAKAGTYRYFCDIHPGMIGTVKVVKKRGAVPGAKADARAVKKQVAAGLKTLKTISQTTVGAETVQVGGAGKGGVESFDFFPASPAVKVGTTVTFTMPVGSTEAHTATTGPGNIEDPASYIGALAAGFEAPAIPGAALYPSDVPGQTAASLTKTLHGNGFWNTGVIDAVDQSPPPASNKVTFAEAGQFDFYCLIHPFMKATVTVSP
jgi:plastocyanin